MCLYGVYGHVQYVYAVYLTYLSNYIRVYYNLQSTSYYRSTTHTSFITTVNHKLSNKRSISI